MKNKAVKFLSLMLAVVGMVMLSEQSATAQILLNSGHPCDNLTFTEGEFGCLRVELHCEDSTGQNPNGDCAVWITYGSSLWKTPDRVCSNTDIAICSKSILANVSFCLDACPGSWAEIYFFEGYQCQADDCTQVW